MGGETTEARLARLEALATANTERLDELAQELADLIEDRRQRAAS
jgi:chaperonin cofactor prefoldin